MVTMDPMHPVDKKSALFTSYQQSFRIDDLINNSNPQPDHYPPPSLPSPPPSSSRIEDGSGHGGMGMMGGAMPGKPVSYIAVLNAWLQLPV